MQKIFFAIGVLMTGLCGESSAQTFYELTFPNPNTHYVDVEIHFSGVSRDSFDVEMPVWIPGSYLVREFAKNVEGFKAYNSNRQPFPFKKVRKNVWRIYNDTNSFMSVSYSVYAFELSVRTSYIDIDQAYLNGPSVFMFNEKLKNQPALINIKPWKDWKKISCGIPAFGTFEWSRTAENYDQIADSPILMGNHEVIDFEYQGIPHHIAMAGTANYDKEKVKTDITKIVDACTKIFGDNPNKDYTFIIHNSASGGGGLEHKNSCSIITARNTYENEKSYKNFLSLVAHEYFHLWSVKRIRPVTLGPFDYANENYTNQLWFFEGITSYYDDYIVYKCGFYTEAEYLDIIKGNIQTVLNTPGDHYQSLEEASFDAWIKYYRQNENFRNSCISYYTKGAVLGAVLECDILNTTMGKAGMDDVMRYLYNEYYKKMNRGITDQELQRAFEQVAGKSYKDFFDKYIRGTETIPFEEYLAYAGIQLDRTDGRHIPLGYLGATFNQSGSRLIVSYVERGTAAWEQGLYPNDEIVDVDGKEPMQVRDYLSSKLPGDKVTFRIIRSGLQREFTLVMGELTLVELQIALLKKPSSVQKLVHDKWLSTKK